MIGLFKRNGILLVFFALYWLVIVLAMLELDKQYYQAAKKDLIVENYRGFLDKPLENADATTDSAHLAADAFTSPTLLAQRKLRNRLLIDWQEAGNPIYRIVIRKDNDGELGSPVIDVFDENKFRLSNNFSNSLFLRNFSNFGRGKVRNPDTGAVYSASIYSYYTNPRGDAAIRELTTRYRWYASFILIALTFAAGALARSLLIPLNKALHSLESTTTERTVFCRRPRTRLELLYNRMALDALISRLQSRLRDEIADNPQLSGWETVAFVCRALRSQTGIGVIAGVELSAPGPGDLQPTGRRLIAAERKGIGEEGALADRMLESVPQSGATAAPLEFESADTQWLGELCVVSDPDRPASRYILTALLDRRDAESEGTLAGALLGALVELTEAGLHTLSLRNQLVVKERGRANISLSRNLGHDLTNIIAGAKLDLMALERLMRQGKLPDDAMRLEILRDSFHGLLRSVRFMQETVNLYRSYAFLQHPVLEIHDGNALMNETLDLFAMSISGKIEIKRDLAADAPRCMVDPRLFKLALFNLFSNSLKAIRQTGPDRAAASGWIRAETRLAQNGGLAVAIEDSGTGIIDPDGRKLTARETAKIFDLGYTSAAREADAGEGLGLNWVRTIVEDLHAGTIRAENLPDAGARFIISLPPLDRAPDIANAERKAREYMRQFDR